jgi:2'-5' RNA ligase
MNTDTACATIRDRYFIAVLPPQEMLDYANEVRQYFSDRYDSRKSFSSPPHVTLIPPFDWNQNPESIQQALTTFAETTAAFPITLSGFGRFPQNVIYINVLKDEPLLTLQSRLTDHCRATLGLTSHYSNQPVDLPFVPHMTVAFRDLTTENFKNAWTEFESKPLGLSNQSDRTYQFLCDRLALLKHDGQVWQPYWDVTLEPIG